MSRPALSNLMSRVVGLLVLPILALPTACGAPEESKPRPLPEEMEQRLRPGEYRSEEFEPPLTFRVGEGWQTTTLPEARHLLIVRRAGGLALGFISGGEVYAPTETGEPKVVVPKDLVGWFGRHPHLETTEPQPVTVGGVEGERFDVTLGDLPDGYLSVCGRDCVAILRSSDGFTLYVYPDTKLRLTVLEDVEGKTVVMGFDIPAAEFDEFAPEAQRVFDTVTWRGK